MKQGNSFAKDYFLLLGSIFGFSAACVLVSVLIVLALDLLGVIP